jgi:hypothetical protein
MQWLGRFLLDAIWLLLSLVVIMTALGAIYKTTEGKVPPWLVAMTVLAVIFGIKWLF